MIVARQTLDLIGISELNTWHGLQNVILRVIHNSDKIYVVMKINEDRLGGKAQINNSKYRTDTVYQCHI